MQTGDIFVKPTEEQVKQWYKYFFSLNNQANPFHPINGGQFVEKNNNNQGLIFVGGVTATTQPAKQPSKIPNVNAIVAGAQAKAVYNDGDGNPVQNLPAINKRAITISQGDNRDLYVPMSTELATATKYPKLENNLGELAKKIIDREDINGAPPAYVEFDDGQGSNIMLYGSQLKPQFRVNGTIDQLNVPPNNVGLLPEGTGPAAFSDYAAILKHDALKPGKNTLRFGVDGKFFSYTVEYEINVVTTSGGNQNQQTQSSKL